MKVIVVGPPLVKQGSGIGWIKHNIVSALKSVGNDVWSVCSHSSNAGSIVASTIISKESRDDNDIVEVDEIIINAQNAAVHWEEIKQLVKPDVVICLGEPEQNWFVIGEERDPKVKTVFYYLSEAKTMNRYIPIKNHAGVYEEESLDVSVLFSEFDLVIPATPVTTIALTKDMKMSDSNISDHLTPPVHTWEVSSEKAIQYRRAVSIEPTCKVYYCIAMNTPRKRLDQVMIYFTFHLLKKPCDKLVIHSSPHGATDLVAAAQRLGIVRNLRINTKISKDTMEGVMSAGDEFISLPAAEGYGLPLWESLVLNKKVIHTSVGYPQEGLSKLRGKHVTLLDAPNPYFYSIGNQAWYAISRNPEVIKTGISKKGDYDLEDIVNTPSQFREKFIDLLRRKEIIVS
ncbi:MAG: glycosyltransferase family 1 protein [Spirochaetes bacterium]|nr:MAG: glycosyltransferase family 1 protein [Spirochaetota bacterium]